MVHGRIHDTRQLFFCAGVDGGKKHATINNQTTINTRDVHKIAHQIAELVEGREAPHTTQTQQLIGASIGGFTERFIVAFGGTGIVA